MAEAEKSSSSEAHHDMLGSNGNSKDDCEFSKPILQAGMKIGKLVFNVYLEKTSLSWVKQGKPKEKAVIIPVQEILSVSKITAKKNNGCEVVGFTISCVRHMKNNVLKREMVQFLCDSREGEEWSEKIQAAIEQVTARPKRLLVIINPESGGKAGRKIYNDKVAGIFKQANIDTDVIVTERAHHCEEILSKYDLSSLNGIVLVGGDGIYHEAVNGLARRSLKTTKLVENTTGASLPVIPVPIGLIPTGTGNGIASACYGCWDVETAALSIIIGRLKPDNLLGVYCQEELVAYAGVLLGYGIWGDFIHDAETKRALGRLRYPVAISKTMLIKRHRQMDLGIEYLPPAYSAQDKESVKDQQIKDSVEEKSNVDKSQMIQEGNKCKEQSKPAMDTGQFNVEEIINTKDRDKLLIDQPTLQQKIKNTRPEKTDNNSVELLTNTQEDCSVVQSVTVCDPGESGASQLVTESEMDNSRSISKEWKKFQGIYTGVMFYDGDYWSHREKETAQESCTRLMINKPSGGLQLLTFLFKLITRQPQALEISPSDNMQVKEVKVRLNNPSGPDTENCKLEHLINLDGEVFYLKQPEFHVIFFPKVVQLFVSPQMNEYR